MRLLTESIFRGTQGSLMAFVQGVSELLEAQVCCISPISPLSKQECLLKWSVSCLIFVNWVFEGLKVIFVFHKEQV